MQDEESQKLAEEAAHKEEARRAAEDAQKAKEKAKNEAQQKAQQDARSKIVQDSAKQHVQAPQMAVARSGAGMQPAIQQPPALQAMPTQPVHQSVSQNQAAREQVVQGQVPSQHPLPVHVARQQVLNSAKKPEQQHSPQTHQQVVQQPSSQVQQQIGEKLIEQRGSTQQQVYQVQGPRQATQNGQPQQPVASQQAMQDVAQRQAHDAHGHLQASEHQSAAGYASPGVQAEELAVQVVGLYEAGDPVWISNRAAARDF